MSHHVKSCQDRTPHERWLNLRIHIMIFVIVNCGLTALNVVRHPDKLWFYWPLCGWGLGLLLHAWIVFTKRERKVNA